MPGTRYLEFDSTYRNRILYPDPSNFVIEMSQSGQKSQENALDPISFASPIISWNTSFIEGKSSTTIGVTNVVVINATTDQVVLQVTFADTPRTITNFYNSAVLSLGTGGPPSTAFERKRITSYKAVTATVGLVTVDSAFSTDLSTVTGGSVENPTNDTSAVVVPLLFIPTGRSIDNFYINYIVDLYSIALGVVSIGESVTITSYNGTTHLATLSQNTTANWLDGDLNFALRKVAPQPPAPISAVVNPVSASGRSIQLSAGSPVSGTLVNSFLRMVKTSLGALPTAGDSTPGAPYGEERRIVRYIAGDGVIQAVSGAVITLRAQDIGASDYTGAIFTDVTAVGASEVVSYNSATRQITLAGAIAGSAIGDVWTMRTAVVETGFTVAPSIAGANTYEIENYTRDNATPFNYTGSLDSVQEMCCYEVELINLIIPNAIQLSGRGGRPIFQPYLYVELQQMSASSSGNRGIIYSNNPNSTRMLFRAILDDTTLPAYSPFIKIDSDGMTHNIKFRPTDGFRFAVFDPDGSPFETTEADTVGPTEPNPLAQISACFSFKRV